MQYTNKHKHFKVLETIKTKKGNIKRGEFYCILNNKTYNTLGGYRNGIRHTGFTVRQIYDTYYKTPEEGYCMGCQNETKFSNIVVGYLKWCSDKCYLKSDKHRAIVSAKFNNSPEVLENFRKTRRKWLISLSETDKKRIHDKRVNTLRVKYGEDYFNHLAKRANILWQSADIEKRKATYAKGVETRRKNGTLQHRLCNGRNKNIIINNSSYTVQGFEDAFLLYCVEKQIEFVLGDDMPTIIRPSVKSGLFVPDFYLPEYNLIVDIKSNWTYNCDGISNLLDKQKCVHAMGYNCIFIIVKTLTKKINDNTPRAFLSNDLKEINEFFNMLISSQAPKSKGKVQRLSEESEYTLNAIGSGSTMDPTQNWIVI